MNEQEFLEKWKASHKDGVAPIEIEEYYTVIKKPSIVAEIKKPIIDYSIPEKKFSLTREDMIRVEKQLEELRYSQRDIDYVEIIKRWSQGTYEILNYTDRGYSGKYAARVEPIEIVAITVDNGVIEIPKRNFI